MESSSKISYATNYHFKKRFYIFVKTRVKPVIYLQKNIKDLKCFIIAVLLNKSEAKATNNRSSKTYTTT